MTNGDIQHGRGEGRITASSQQLGQIGHDALRSMHLVPEQEIVITPATPSLERPAADDREHSHEDPGLAALRPFRLLPGQTLDRSRLDLDEQSGTAEKMSPTPANDDEGHRADDGYGGAFKRSRPRPAQQEDIALTTEGARILGIVEDPQPEDELKAYRESGGATGPTGPEAA